MSSGKPFFPNSSYVANLGTDKITVFPKLRLIVSFTLYSDIIPVYGR